MNRRNKHYIIGVAVVALFLVFVYQAMLRGELTVNDVNTTQEVATSTAAEVSSLPATEIGTLSLEGWVSFSGEESGLKRHISFIYPSVWSNDGVTAGGANANVIFFDQGVDTTKIQRYLLNGVAFLLADSYPQNTKYPFDKTVPIEKEIPIVIDGKEGKIFYQTNTSSTTYPGGWWAIFENNIEINTSITYMSTFTFQMDDDYDNSEEVFTKMIESIRWGEIPTD